MNKKTIRPFSGFGIKVANEYGFICEEIRLEPISLLDNTGKLNLTNHSLVDSSDLFLCRFPDEVVLITKEPFTNFKTFEEATMFALFQTTSAIIFRVWLKMEGKWQTL